MKIRPTTAKVKPDPMKMQDVLSPKASPERKPRAQPIWNAYATNSPSKGRPTTSPSKRFEPILKPQNLNQSVLLPSERKPAVPSHNVAISPYKSHKQKTSEIIQKKP